MVYGLVCQLYATAQTASNDLFGSEEILSFTLSGNTRDLFNDRSDKALYHPLVLSYKSDTGEVTINLKAKTRGNFRRNSQNCIYPPILLNFPRKEAKPSLFQQQDKLKLVVPCRGEDYVIREYLVYKLYNLLTPKSYKARLVHVTFDDMEKKRATTLYGILLEEDEQMAERNKMQIVEKKMLPGESTETETFLKMAVFQYMIGNTDWSVPYQHNIRTIAFDSLSVPYVVPYDFDHAGIVDASYAVPAEQLALSSTRERRFRGYCITDIKAFDETIATFNRLKNDFYKVYADCPLLDKRYIAATTKFLNQFYETINDPKKVKIAFSYPCKGTQNVIIKGLKE